MVGQVRKSDTVCSWNNKMLYWRKGEKTWEGCAMKPQQYPETQGSTERVSIATVSRFSLQKKGSNLTEAMWAYLGGRPPASGI